VNEGIQKKLIDLGWTPPPSPMTLEKVSQQVISRHDAARWRWLRQQRLWPENLSRLYTPEEFDTLADLGMIEELNLKAFREKNKKMLAGYTTL